MLEHVAVVSVVLDNVTVRTAKADRSATSWSPACERAARSPTRMMSYLQASRLEGSCRLTRQLSRRTGHREASFDKPGGCGIGGAGKARLLAADCHLELAGLNYRAAVVCDHC